MAYKNHVKRDSERVIKLKRIKKKNISHMGRIVLEFAAPLSVVSVVLACAHFGFGI